MITHAFNKSGEKPTSPEPKKEPTFSHPPSFQCRPNLLMFSRAWKHRTLSHLWSGSRLQWLIGGTKEQLGPRWKRNNKKWMNGKRVETRGTKTQLCSWWGVIIYELYTCWHLARKGKSLSSTLFAGTAINDLSCFSFS